MGLARERRFACNSGMAASTSYQTLVEAAASLANMEQIAELGDTSVAAAAAFSRQNHDTLESARRCLGPGCAVTLRFEESFYNEHTGHVSHLRNLALAFRAEAYLAAQGGDYQAAAKSGLDILELANAVRRGGLVTDLLISFAISGIGLETIRAHRKKFDSATRRLLMDRLARLEAECEPIATITARDRDWEAAVGWTDQGCDFASLGLNFPAEDGLSEEEQRQLLQLLQTVADLPQADKESMYLDQDHQVLALMRLLTIDFALLERHLAAGRYPEQLSELVPNFFPRLPLDPFSGESFIYQRVGDAAFYLCSAGSKMDDGLQGVTS